MFSTSGDVSLDLKTRVDYFICSLYVLHIPHSLTPLPPMGRFLNPNCLLIVFLL